MFGDIGHGVVLLTIGWVLHKRWPAVTVLIPCGASAVLFGFLFGSIFGNEHLITPLWMNPVDDPLVVLMVPLVGGVVILLLGLFLQSLEAVWSGQFRHWTMTQAPVIVMYLSLIAALFVDGAMIAFTVGLLWYLAGHYLVATERPLIKVLVSVGELVESLFQLVVNSVSFIRVGAFALAHAGLSLAFIIMAESAGNVVVATLLIIVGNVIVILLEGLVVSIQTTRLVLFEFFIRFLRGSGRSLKPLSAPEHTYLRHTRRT